MQSTHLLSGVFVASFLESTVVPVPIEALLLPLMQMRRDKIWGIALVAVLGCMLGALVGYAIGLLLFDLLRDWLIANVIAEQDLNNLLERMRTEGFWFVLTLGIAPIPLQIGMLAAGATQFSLFLFLLATALSRALRYFGIAVVVFYAGNQAEKLIRQYKMSTIAVLCVLLLGLYTLTTST